MPDPLRAVLRRAFWALLVLVHAPALLGVARSVLADPGASNLSAGLVLVLTVALFGLKLADVAFLRLPSRPGSVLAFVVAFCLVHHEAALSEAGQAAIAQTPAALATGVLVEGARRAARVMRHLRDWLRAAGAVWHPLWTCGLVAVEERAAIMTAHRAMPGAPRAPPA